MRHAQSLYNAGYRIDIEDCELSPRGRESVVDITGHYDLIICSNMKRALQTLENSRITYTSLLISDLIREYKRASCDFLKNEDPIKESSHDLIDRVNAFKEFLFSLKNINTVLIISHRIFLYHLSDIDFDNSQIRLMFDK